MNNKYFKDNIILGGLDQLTNEAEELRRMQIKDGVRIHTCNNYHDSLNVIKNASFGIETKVRLLTKVYYRYPDSKHIRFRPIIDQLDEIVSKLNYIPTDWSLQLCCYCRYRQLISENAQKFFFKINKKFKVKKIYLEYYPIYKYDFLDLVNLNKFYRKKLTFGLIGYQNLLNRVFTNNDLKFLSSNQLDLCFLGFIGKGIQNKNRDKDLLNIKNDIDPINENINYFLSSQNNLKNLKGLTQVSSIFHYQDLKERFYKIYQSSDCINEKSQEYKKHINIYNFNNFDHYGGLYSYEDYFKKPKLLFSKIKHLIIAYIKSLNFNKNYWG